jgi:hypothetical protein
MFLTAAVLLGAAGGAAAAAPPLGFKPNIIFCLGRPGAVKRRQRFYSQISFVWRFRVGAQCVGG